MDPYRGSQQPRMKQEEEEEAQYPSIQNNKNNKNVMTDEQIEELRKQIAAYTVISGQLAHTYMTMSANHHFATGVRRMVNPYYERMLGLRLGLVTGPVGQKMSGSRQRWTPTPVQLDMLERIYDENGTPPTKQKIKDITVQLAQHGQISEANVFNWFQNRRARSKKKPKPSASAPSSINIAANAKTMANKPDNPAQGHEELSGKEESSRSYDSYTNLAEQYDLPG